MDTRDELYDTLTKEIIGPGNTQSEYLFENHQDQELLLQRVHGAPHKRYGAGMLYPKGIIEQLIDDGENDDKITPSINQLDNESPTQNDYIKNGNGSDDSSSSDDPVSMTNAFKPSAMGVTFRVKINSELVIKFKSAYYQRTEDQPVYKKDEEGNKVISTYSSGDNMGQPIMSNAWLRRPCNNIEDIKLKTSSDWKRGIIQENIILTNGDSPWLTYKIYNRSTSEDQRIGVQTITIVLENLAQKNRSEPDYNEFILFQNSFSVICENHFYPLVEKESKIDAEVNQMNLLYRNKKGFAIGHGVAAEWNDPLQPNKIETSFLPKYELPVIASNETSNLILSMYDMSDLGDWEKGKRQINKLISEYENWVQGLDNEILNLEKEYYKAAAEANKQNCQEVLQRIKVGYELLINPKNESILKCFRWMNRAMIWQQQRSKAKQRIWIKQRTGNQVIHALEDIDNIQKQEFETLKDFSQQENKGKWRPFQIAFILMNLKSVIDPNSEDRKTVDLIWFPTGGGKTEAYLGLSAFNIFWRRMRGNEIGLNHVLGTSIIMRYTLRLLTAQQFERASSLIVACDLIRRENMIDLGSDNISIGLWVGGTTTPNDNIKAISQFNDLNQSYDAPYNFIVLKCPCCAAQIGKLEKENRTTRLKIKGLSRNDRGPVKFRCENNNCEYHNKILPVDIVDTYLFENPPTLLLGTVDKFAMLTWKATIRENNSIKQGTDKFFGFRVDANKNLKRILPPDMIIQDELHLISGPLGSMVGLYETMVQTLCNQYKHIDTGYLPNMESIYEFIPPKIVASTATISRAKDQVKALYATEKMCLFPPQALEFGETWFSEVTKEKGRQYVGVCTPGYPSPQTTIVRSYAAILQKVKLEDDKKDVNYYWTLLGYFNSIRELGGAVSLVAADIKERLSQIQNRELLDKSQKRFIKYKELTSRIPSNEIPEALKNLEVDYVKGSNKAIGLCLATNMIATGVDISRFGLMFIHGQPKTTAEYIQASSRVGRDPKGPGLVVVLYNPSKPRDKSQYEHFMTYHSRIYGSVEPTSVTPFTINAIDRALHAVFVGLIRHFTTSISLRENANTNHTDFEEISKILKQIIIKRCEIVDVKEANRALTTLDSIILNWKNNYNSYGDAGNYRILQNEDFTPLLYAAGGEVTNRIENESNSLKTPTSMRGTDEEVNLARI